MKKRAAEIGHHRWAFAGGHIPLVSVGEEPEFTSHDRLAVMNAGSDEVDINLSVYYEDRDPVEGYCMNVKAGRLHCHRINDLIDPLPVPLDTPYGIVLMASEPVVVQFSRQDTGSSSTTNFSITPFAMEDDEFDKSISDMTIGHRRWAVAEACLYPGNAAGPELYGYDTVCILNTNEPDAHIQLIFHFTDRDAIGPYNFVVGGRRVRHIKLSDLSDPLPLPFNTAYAMVISADVPVVVQYTIREKHQTVSTSRTAIGVTVN